MCISIEGGSIVQETGMSLLPAWQNFYVIIGSAAAALTGLMFVVITLIARAGQRRSSESVGAFGTPTVVHSTKVYFGTMRFLISSVAHKICYTSVGS